MNGVIIVVALPTFCHRIGKLLPSLWQSFAKLMAKSCHTYGKTLPLRWQA
jgi:hypothetical protein